MKSVNETRLGEHASAGLLVVLCIIGVASLFIVIQRYMQPPASASVVTGYVPAAWPITINTTHMSDDYNETLITTVNQLGSLPLIDLTKLETAQQYKEFADHVNDAIRILNADGKLGYQIPMLEGTVEEYQKLSRVVTEYGPLIRPYNNLVTASREFDIHNETSVNVFYVKGGVFSIEVAIIATTFYAKPVYEVVGTIYRASGLQTIAFKCGPCVSVILENAHWFVRTALVTESAQIAETILNAVRNLV